MKMIPKLLAVSVVAALPALSFSASHREAPAIAFDPAADITDVYAFRSWEDPSKLVFIMNVLPGQEPSAAPNYYNFDDPVAYDINLDTNKDGKADDIVYRIQFKTELRAPFINLPIAYGGVDTVPGLPPAIRGLDGADSVGLGLRQTYTVTEIKGTQSRELSTGKLVAAPSNIGPRTMPDYQDLSEQGIYPLVNGGRVFAGQRDEAFYIDLGAFFDTLNFRAPPILTADQDANDFANPFGNDMFSGFNVNSIAIEVPISEVTSDANAVIGMYASTSRPRYKTINKLGQTVYSGAFVQVARMGNPLVNELIIGTGKKDLWNATEPEKEAQFLDFYLNPRPTSLINAAFGTNFPTTGRTDLVAALLKYPGQPAKCTRASLCSDLLRLNVSVPPTAPAAQKRLTVLAGDKAGFPNGRRPNDDVTDIALRVVSGALLGIPVPNLGDGVNFNIGANGINLTKNGIYKVFPFLPKPHDGRNRRHIDCNEPGAKPCN
ncbi:MAG: DUF4331 domain-containing protein [Methylovulum sp.]|uniref:DUF4331 domain-containing protein n=1 Tax=Methylovulum sp. TaxID=1916980 RepID=UPI0026225E01|nr:DUF4331 domain-containing protein [Methylovulum sp.]MDD2722459.1 DUF4331 domain-containing protein [Methylovulum sp.]MDD5124491.1 DUF4331 domain-containing protein [Methylovulum sp.]